MIRVGKWLALFFVAMLVLTGCGRFSAKAPTFTDETGKLKVAVSFWPMYEFTRMVGGDKIEVVTMTPVGVEPHDWEPSAGHMKTLNQAALFIYNGAGMEPWVTKALKSLDNKKLIAIETTAGLDLLDAPADDGHGHSHSHGKKGSEPEKDPHVWLDPELAARQVNAIVAGLVQADPVNRATYEANAAAYVKELNGLHAEFQSGLAGCGKQEIFTSHAAYGYLAARYGLAQHALMGLSPSAEPKPRTMKQIVQEAKEHQIKYVFFETLVSDKVARVLAKEIGAETLVLNPLEGLTPEEIQAGKSYLSVMRENLKNLRLALDCK